MSGTEADLREYVRVLRRWWWLAIAPPLVAVALVLVSYRAEKPVYEATALLAFAERRALDTTGAVSSPQVDVEGYLLLAESDELLQHLLLELGQAPEGVDTVGRLRALLRARLSNETSPKDSRVLQLTARSPDSGAAVRIANLWADTLATHANELFGTREQEVEEAAARLAQAEQNLAASEAFQKLETVRARLLSAEQALQGTLAENSRIERAVQRARALGSWARSQPAESRVAAEDELALLLIQLQAWRGAEAGRVEMGGTSAPVANSAGGVLAGPDSSKMTVQFPAESAISLALQWPQYADVSSIRTMGQLSRYLDQLCSAFEVQMHDLDEQAVALERQASSLRLEMQELDAQTYQFTCRRDLTRETYLQSVRRFEEARSGGAAGVEWRVVSHAAAARAVVERYPHKAFAAAVLGLMAGVLGAFAAEWWRRAPRQKPDRLRPA